MDAPKEISIRSASNEEEGNDGSGVFVETVIGGDNDSDNDSDIINGSDQDDGEGFQGRVAFHGNAASNRRHRNVGRRSARPATSSWASNDDIIRASVEQQRFQTRQLKRRERATVMAMNAHQKRREEMMASIDNRSAPTRLGLRRIRTPKTNNLSAGDFVSELDDSIYEEDLTLLMSPSAMLDREMGTETGKGTGTPNSKQNKQQPARKQSSSFRNWLAEGMLDTLNTVAGITLSTTGTILSPPIAMTRNVILPALLGMFVDALDAATPPRVQDWFRILSTSVYHLFCVLISGSTEKGLEFRNQVGVVAGSFVEAWSAPESRQVVVDGMATGVKLADALHTPEMELFLDQLGVLGCRVVDAMASGKAKEFIQNSKELLWRSIELASDPSTTLALVEVTAHLCHALEEVDESFQSATPRAMRNAYNEKTYLNSSLMTKDYPFESTEQIILSSLGIGNNTKGNKFHNEGLPVMDDIDASIDDDTTEHSIPSNVAFHAEGGTSLEGLNLDQNDTKISHLEKYKNKIDIELLQETILRERRPRSRRTLIEKSQWQPLKQRSTEASLTSDIGNDPKTKGQCISSRNTRDRDEEDMEELPLDLKLKNRASIPNRYASNLKDLYSKFEAMESKELGEPSVVQFYDAIDNLLKKKREERKIQEQKWMKVEVEGEGSTRAGRQSEGGRKTGKVRKFRKGIVKEEKSTSRAMKERYMNLRRLWKYPPSFLRVVAVVGLFMCIFWVGFGIYGMYTFFHKVFHNGPVGIPDHPYTVHSPAMPLPPPSPPPLPQQSFGVDDTAAQENVKHENCRYDGAAKINSSPNELVIRIVKEIVHVREDGSRIEDYNDEDNADSFDPLTGGFSQEEIDKFAKFVASYQ